MERNPTTSCREMPEKGTICTGYLQARHQIGMPEPFTAEITAEIEEAIRSRRSLVRESGRPDRPNVTIE